MQHLLPPLMEWPFLLRIDCQCEMEHPLLELDTPPNVEPKFCNQQTEKG